ncbi:MAG: ferredoxin:thioredoxin reductase [Methanospirillaceae archaeon]|nr:ferredoxin:thioredoxin reductase [Methanospirillaceae archaeon]
MNMIDINAMREKTREYADENGFFLNHDPKALETVLKGLVRNLEKYGEPYCPCRIRTGDHEKDKDIICPCVFHKDEIRDQGRCHCNLFFSTE